MHVDFHLVILVQIRLEREEAERRELHKMMMEGDDKGKDLKKDLKQEEDPMANVVRILSVCLSV